MEIVVGVLYVAAIVLLVVAAFGARVRVSLPLLAAACALTAYALPAVVDGLRGL